MSFLPTNVPNCAIWLDPTDATTFTFDGSNILEWRDKVSSLAFIPYVAGPAYATAYYNGLNAVYFSGSTSVNNAGYSFPNTSFSFFAVGILNGGGSYRRLINGGGGGADGILFLGALDSAYASFTGSVSGWNDTSVNSPGVGVGTFCIMEMVVNGSVLTPYVNGSPQDTKTGTTIAFSGLNIGGFSSGWDGQAWIGHCGDVVLYSTALNTAQRQQVEGCLAWKWNLQSSLPVDHPYRNNPPEAVSQFPIDIDAAQAQWVPNPPSIPYTLPSAFTLNKTTPLPGGNILQNTPIPAMISNRKWVPTSLSDLSLWLDATDNATLTLTGSDVTEWRDKSGFNYNATGYGGTALTSVGGRQAITLNGTDTYFYSSNASAMNTTSNVSAFVVATFGDMGASAWRRLLSFGDPDFNDLNNCVAFDRYLTDNTLTAERDGNLGSGLITFTPPQNFMASVVFNSTSITQYVNGSFNAGTSGVGPAFNYSLYNVGRYSGGGYNWTGAIGEVIAYNSNISDADRQKVEGYLAWKWRLQGSLPWTHPYRLFPPPPPPVSSGATVIFTYTGSAQTIVIPAGITSIQVYLWGAGGGGYGYTDGGAFNGGAGAYVSGTLAVSPGSTLTIIVGLGGSPNASAGTLEQGGGGSAGIPPNNASSGGGRSAIQLAGEDIVTAGGGSGGAWVPGSAATWSGTSNPGYGATGGGGGTQVAGGVGGFTDGGYNFPTAGSKGQGGDGAGYASGGGGGWYGGGGGGTVPGQGGSGGAGSSYTDLLTGATGEDGSVPDAPATTSPYYGNNAGRGGQSGFETGGNGRVVIVY